MAHDSGDLGWFEPNDLWQTEPSTLQDLVLWDSADPLLAAPESRTTQSYGSPHHGGPKENAHWPAATSALEEASGDVLRPQVHAFDGDVVLQDAAPDSECYVNPQDTIFSPEYSTVRRLPVFPEAHHNTTPETTFARQATEGMKHADRISPRDRHVESGSPVEPRSKKQRRARLPYAATSRFKAWFSEHSNYPYPTHDDVLALAQETQTTPKQVKSWFTNSRTRLRNSSSSSIPDRVDTSHHRQGLTTSALETWSRTSGSPRSLDSVKRYLDLPTEGLECAVETPSASITAASTTDQETSSSAAEEVPPWMAESAGQQYSTAPSVSGSDHHSVFSAISLASMGSALSGQTSFTSASASGGSRRRGKRRFDHLDSDTSLVCKKFPCTFCAKTFATTYDWKRHEATHLPFVAQWICMPDDTAIDEDGECMLCFAPDADEAHMLLHGVDGCRQKPVEQRTFGRKDQLKQHIEICHLTKAQKADSHMLNKFLDHWHREVELSWRNDEHKEALWCGFCCTHSHAWKERQDHVAEHLRNGCGMANWHSYRKFIAYCKEKWDEKHAATFKEYSQYVDHLIAGLKAENK